MCIRDSLNVDRVGVGLWDILLLFFCFLMRVTSLIPISSEITSDSYSRNPLTLSFGRFKDKSKGKF